MSIVLEVTPAELRNAANALENQLVTFEEANNKTNTTATNLASMWEGESHDKFITQHERYQAAFSQLIEAIRSNLTELRAAADRYEQMDASVGSAIG